MIENNPNNVSSAFEMRLEEVENGVKSPISSCYFKIGVGYSGYVANIKE